MSYRMTKTYGNERGLSCCFRQHRASGHCSLLHGYSLGVEVILEASELNENNWVFDFGDLNQLERWLRNQFDHKTVVAHDDPLISTFRELDTAGLIELVIIDNVGCESFARHIADYLSDFLLRGQDRVSLFSVRVFEHSANSATYLEK